MDNLDEAEEMAMQEGAARELDATRHLEFDLMVREHPPMVLSPAALPEGPVEVLAEDDRVGVEVESALRFLGHPIEDGGRPVAVDHASMVGHPEADWMPLPVGQAWGWLGGTVDMRRFGVEEWMINAISHINQHKMEGTHPFLVGGLKAVMDIGRQSRRNVEQVIGLLADDLSRETFVAIVDCDFHSLIELYKKRAFSAVQYFEGLRIDPDKDRVLNVGIHSGWDLPYWLLQTRNVVSVDPIAPSYLDPYVRPFVMAANPDLNVCALDSYTGKCVLPVTGDGQAMGGANGLDLLIKSEEFDCASLDDFAHSFGLFSVIKMDTEGAERNILWGGRNFLRAVRPQMAISIYHRTNDFWDIPLWVHRHLGGYRLYIRPYSFSGVETVLYAIPEGVETPAGLMSPAPS